MKRSRPTVIDLFAGCGGLSCGLRKAGFRVVAAIEIDKAAADTYRKNIKRCRLVVDDVRNVDPATLNNRVPVTLLAGCAPCQGFCSLTRKHHKNDPRNQLLLDMARFVGELKPTAILMENVPDLLTRGKPIFDEFVRQVRASGYYPAWKVVQMADYGVPQKRRRLVLVAGHGFAVPFPEATHGRVAQDGRKRWRTVRDAIGDMRAPVSLKVAARTGGPKRHLWHVVRDLQAHTKARLRAAIPGQTWLSLNQDLRPKCHRGSYDGFTNVYGRMVWDQPSPAITGGCTTPCKGRFGHPDRRRTTISVREAAILQSFPRGYRFATDYMDVASEMVGNAVPPLFAQVMGRKVLQSIKAHEDALAHRRATTH